MEKKQDKKMEWSTPELIDLSPERLADGVPVGCTGGSLPFACISNGVQATGVCNAGGGL